MSSRVKDILDIVAKLTAAGAVVAVAFVTNSFQSSLTATNLLSQREQADSTLRSGMFHDLIGPIVGSQEGKGIPADRERLLVELLSLNFHEHFELKPIMLHVDYRLAHETIQGMDQAQKENARESLRSIARRVLQRQLAMLTKSEINISPERGACVYRLDIEGRPQQWWDLVSLQLDDGTELLLYLLRSKDGKSDFAQGILVTRAGEARYLDKENWSSQATGLKTDAVEPGRWILELPQEGMRMVLIPKDAILPGSPYWAGDVRVESEDGVPLGQGYVETTKSPSPQPCSTFAKYFDDLITINSPNGAYNLAFTVAPFSWEDQSFKVSILIKAADNNSKMVPAGHDFRLTWFDFPYTDNTLLADGTRFSLVIDRVKPKEEKVTLKIVWFPQDYFAARERPTNYRQLREKLGLTLK